MRPATKRRAKRKKPLSPAEIRRLGIRSRVTAEANGLCQECGAVAICNIRAERYFSPERNENGLAVPWFGRVFLNPPGGKCDAAGMQVFQRKGVRGFFYADGSPYLGPTRYSTKAWWQRLAAEWQAGRVTSAIFVGFSLEVLQTTQVDAVGPIPLEFPFCVPSRRIAYRKPAGNGDVVVGASPPHGSVIVCLPPRGDLGAFIGMRRQIGARRRFRRFFWASGVNARPCQERHASVGRGTR